MSLTPSAALPHCVHQLCSRWHHKMAAFCSAVQPSLGILHCLMAALGHTHSQGAFLDDSGNAPVAR
jgi:hypothetical protein